MPTWITYRCRHCGEEREAVVGSYAHVSLTCTRQMCMERRADDEPDGWQRLALAWWRKA